MTDRLDVDRFDHVLNICLDRLQAGDTLEACLASYPSHAEQLASLLEVAAVLRTPEGPSMSAEGLRAGEARLLAHAARLHARHSRRPAPARRKGIPGLLAGTRRLLAVTLAGILLVSGMLSAGTVSAASASLPGSPLYPVKRTTESVLSSVAFTPQLQARVHLAWADRRLREVEVLIRRNGVVDESLLAAMAQETERGLFAAEQAGLESLTAAVAQTGRQQAVLSQLLDEAPQAARSGLERALTASAHGHARARYALEQAAGPGPPITPPGHADDQKPAHTEAETPAAADTPGASMGPSEAKDESQPVGGGRGQDGKPAPGEGAGQGQGRGQDESQDRDRGQGQGKGQGRDDGEDYLNQGQGPDKAESHPPGQGEAPTPGDDPDQGPGGGRNEKTEKPGQGKDKKSK